MNIKIYAFADEACNDLDGQIAAMRENQLDGLEIRTVDGIGIADLPIQKAHEVKKRLDDAGLRVWSIGSPIGKIHLVRDDFHAHLEKYKHTLELAELFHAECFRLFSFYLPSENNPDFYKETVIERMGEFVRLAKDIPVTLCHENEKGIFGETAARCLELHQALPTIKGIFDPANFIQSGENTDEAFRLLRPYIKYMHIKDALKNGSVVPAGKGVGNILPIAKAFIQDGGSAFTIEPHLTIFDALSTLEQDGKRSAIGNFVYESRRAAFDVACNEFQTILQQIEL